MHHQIIKQRIETCAWDYADELHGKDPKGGTERSKAALRSECFQDYRQGANLLSPDLAQALELLEGIKDMLKGISLEYTKALDEASGIERQLIVEEMRETDISIRDIETLLAKYKPGA